MKKLLLSSLFIALAALLNAQSLAQDPVVYQYLAGRANDHSWQMNGILFREDPAVPMLTRSFTNNFLYRYAISNTMPALEYGNGKAFVASVPGALQINKSFYSIAGTDQSLLHGFSFDKRFGKSPKTRWVKAMFAHQYYQKRTDTNNDHFLDRPLNNDINASIVHYMNINDNTSLSTSASAFSERWTNDPDLSSLPAFAAYSSHNSNYYAVRSSFAHTKPGKRQQTSADVQASSFSQESRTGMYHYTIGNKKITATGGWSSGQKWDFVSAAAKAIVSAESLDETIDTMEYDRSGITAGAFAEMSIRPRSWLGIELRHRTTHSTVYGWQHAPLARIGIYKFPKVKMFAYGMIDQQVMHPLASSVQYITGTRKVIWHETSLDRYARTGAHINDTYMRWLHFRASYNYTHYFTRNLVDVYSTPNTLFLYSVRNASRDHTVEASVNSSSFWNSIVISMLYRFDDVKARIAGSMRQLPNYPRHSAMLDLSFSRSWYSYSNYKSYYYPTINGTILFSDGIYEPVSNDGTIAKAPALFTLHAKAFIPFASFYLLRDPNEKNKWLEWFQLTVGSDNITNVNRQAVILRSPGDAAGYEGQASRGPLSGRRFYFGLVITPVKKNGY